MAYSTVITPAIRVRRRSERPTVDGSSIIQELGYGETKSYRFFWITAAQLQAEIDSLEAEASDGWVISGEVSRTAIHDALDLFNAQVNLHRYVEEVMTATTTTTTTTTTSSTSSSTSSTVFTTPTTSTTSSTSSTSTSSSSSSTSSTFSTTTTSVSTSSSSSTTTTTTTAPPVFGSEGSTFDRGDFTGTNAFFWSSLDLSPYAGTDLGSTPYKIRLVDGAGKVAAGYIGAVGAGETLGDELISNRTFDNGSGWDEESGTWTYTGAANATGAVQGAIFVYPILNIGRLYKAGYDVSAYTIGAAWQMAGYGAIGVPNAALGTYLEYLTCLGNEAYYLVASANAILSFDNPTAKRVTDPPATAVHIVSSLNGTTRGWASIESGFNPNDIASWDIYAV